MQTVDERVAHSVRRRRKSMGLIKKNFLYEVTTNRWGMVTSLTKLEEREEDGKKSTIHVFTMTHEGTFWVARTQEGETRSRWSLQPVAWACDFPEERHVRQLHKLFRTRRKLTRERVAQAVEAPADQCFVFVAPRG